jgi:uncharacterized membrane protein
MNKDNDPKNWKLGIFYYNKDNPAEFVDKRKGIGTTPNFASKSGRLIFSLIFVPAITVVILLFIIMHSK